MDAFAGHLASFLLAPLALGVINRTKAWFAGRKGQPVLQTYYDLVKLLQKGAVYSTTTTRVFRLGPMVALAAVAAASLLLPVGSGRAAISFPGDLIAFAGLLALARFALVAAALDTGSPFEGMGASREVMLSALAEPAMLLSLTALALVGGSLSLSRALGAVPGAWQGPGGPVLLLAGGALFLLLLAENARIPIDDPNTHLELTMVHEVMVLDHSGPDFAYITYGAALKLWLFSALLAGVLLPVRTGNLAADLALHIAAIGVVALLIGMVESSMARLKMMQVPNVLVVATTVAVLGAGLALVVR